MTVEAADSETLMAEASAAGVPIRRLGLTGGADLHLPGDAPMAVGELAQAYESWFPEFLDGHRS